MTISFFSSKRNKILLEYLSYELHFEILFILFMFLLNLFAAYLTVGLLCATKEETKRV